QSATRELLGLTTRARGVILPGCPPATTRLPRPVPGRGLSAPTTTARPTVAPPTRAGPPTTAVQPTTTAPPTRATPMRPALLTTTAPVGQRVATRSSSDGPSSLERT